MVTLQQSPSCTKMMLEGKVEHHSLKPKATDYAAVFDELNYVGIVQRVDYMIASVLILTTSLLLEHWLNSVCFSWQRRLNMTHSRPLYGCKS